jgi:hypothetical protein
VYFIVDVQVCSLFSEYRGEVLVMNDPPAADRESFFKPLFLVEAIRPPKAHWKMCKLKYHIMLQELCIDLKC